MSYRIAITTTLRRGDIFIASDDITVVGGPGEKEFVLRAPGATLSDIPVTTDTIVKGNFRIGSDAFNKEGSPIRTEVEFKR